MPKTKRNKTQRAVFGYFSKNNYEYMDKIINKLKDDNMETTKSKILELGVIELRKMDYDEIKEKMGELI